MSLKNRDIANVNSEDEPRHDHHHQDDVDDGPKITKVELVEQHHHNTQTNNNNRRYHFEQKNDLNRFESEQDEKEFEKIFARIAQNSTENNKLACVHTSLKYLFKLLKFYRLEHYMNDLIESGMCTPISLSQLSLGDLDRLGVSAYDKKKFTQLKQFVRNVVNTVNRSKAASKATLLRPSSANEESPNSQEEIIMSSLMNNGVPPAVYSSNQNEPPRLNDGGGGGVVNGGKAQLFKKNPNLGVGAKNGGTKKFVRLTSQDKSSHTNGVLAKVGNKMPLQRAKSSEPIENVKQNSHFSLAPSKSTVSIVNSVSHPKLSEANKLNNGNNNFFGPKLQPKTMEIGGISNVKKIENNNYNYGVPQTAQRQLLSQQKHHQSNKLLDKKQQKYLDKIGRNLYKSKSNSNLNSDRTVTNVGGTNSQRVTSDIYVFARKRPKLECESNFNDVIAVEKNSDFDKNEFYDRNERPGLICVNECKSTVDGTAVLRKNDFTFDKTFDSSLTNESIFKSSILPFINLDSIENKVDFTCICFGQTGSGKTHTLFGNKKQDGFCTLTAQYLFSNNQRLFCGFYEIYNGQLYDLINKNNKLVLREDSNGQLNVVGLIEIEVKSLAQLRKTIEQAQLNRHIGTTSFNKASSRSHAIIQFKIQDPNYEVSQASTGLNSNRNTSKFQSIQNLNSAKQTNNTNNNNFGGALKKNQQGSGGSNKFFRIMFIDLAGSERGIDAQNNMQDNRKEGAEINQSLLALKECIRCIDQFYSHAPFRQSKLTRVLRDCFIGNGRTVLIATVSPTDDCVSCSLNTLQYANRVRQMTLRNKKKTQVPQEANKPGVKQTNRQNFNEITNKSTYTTDYPDYRNKLYSTVKATTTTTNTNRHITPSTNPYDAYESISSSEKEKPNTKTVSIVKRQNPEDQQNNKNRPYSMIANKSESATTNNLDKQKDLTKSSTNIIMNGIASARVPAPSLYSDNTYKHNKMNGNSGAEPISEKFENKKEHLFEQISKPIQASSSASIFHPSKINMSSTPIKTSTNYQYNKNDLMLMVDHDTPIKGHKIKYLSSKKITHEQLINQLAEQHFARITVPDRTVAKATVNHPDISFAYDQNNNNNKNNNNNQYQINNRIRVKNDDCESGVESQEDLNKSKSRDSLQMPPQQQNQLNQRASIYSRSPPQNDEPKSNMSNSYSLLNDQSLNRLRQKQREMLVARKLLASSSHRLNHDQEDVDQFSMSVSARSLNDADIFFGSRQNSRIEDSPSKQIETTNSSFNQFRSVINSQKQLRVYIENLELKLNNLKNEMSCERQDGQQQVRKKSSSNESLDSIKECKPIDSKTETTNDFDDEKMLIQMQSAREQEMEDEDDCLKKSLHKGNLTDLYFSKLKTQPDIKLQQPQQNQQQPHQFSPIQSTNFELKKSNELELTLTPRGEHHQLLNPIPIKLSPSSSIDSSSKQIKFDNSFGAVSVNGSDETPRSTTQFIGTSSRIWNKVQSTQNSQSSGEETNGNNLKWSNILMRVGDSGVGMSSGFDQDQKCIISTIPVVYQGTSQTKPKDLLMVAHENQLSDITEACKKEANLLNNLKGSKMEFDDYLKQMDEVLSKKVSSIKDLQCQITQLRTCTNGNADGANITEIAVNSILGHPAAPKEAMHS